MSRDCCTCQYCLPRYGIEHGEVRRCILEDNPNAEIPSDCHILHSNTKQGL